VACTERDRLMELYLEAVQKNNEVGLKVSDMKSEAWRAATKDTREACQIALQDLNSHRREHGC
jgi:hypothetical protein